MKGKERKGKERKGKERKGKVMCNIELLLKLEKIHGNRYAVVFQGKAYVLRTLQEIPIEHILYREMPENGLYRLSPGTCGGKCSIGKPKESCIERKIYNPRKCSVYDFIKIDNDTVKLTYGQLKGIVDNTVWR